MKDKYCKLCEEKGLKSKLKFYSVNFDEGILLCENDMCVYPFGVDVVETFILKTTATQAVSEKQTAERKTKPKKVKRTERPSATQINSSTTNLATEFYWSNSESLCWLDSVMTLLVNNRCLQLCLQKYQPNNSILQELYTDFSEAQKHGPNQRGKETLCNVRMKVFEFLKSKMQCSLGVNDSALSSLNALLKDNSVICEKFSQECEWNFRCSSCEYMQVDRYKKLVVSFPNTTDDFTMPSGVFLRTCYKCKAAGQRSQLDLKRLPPCVMVHFNEGVKNKDCLQSSFVCQGNNYELCQLIQYKKNPDHFIAWIRNENGTHWAEVDDTQDIVCRWQKSIPSFPLDEVHIAVWERAKLFQRKSSTVEIGAKIKTTVAGQGYDRPSDVLCDNLNSRVSNLTPSEDGRLQEIPVVSNGSGNSSNSNNVEGVRNELECKTDVLPGAISDKRKSMEEKANTSVEKRKNTFEPYVPKKIRTSSRVTLSKDEAKTVTGLCLESHVNDKKVTETSLSHLKGVTVVDKDKLGIVCDNQSDSGYSSPGSNNSCVSQASNQCTKAENSIVDELISTLDEIDFAGNERLGTNVQDFDCIGMKSLVVEANAKGDFSECSGDCYFSPSQNNAFGISNSLKLPVSGNFVIKNVSNDECLDRTLKSPSNFADIDTVSNCGTDFLDDVDSLEFLESMDVGLSASVTNGDLLKTSGNLLELEEHVGFQSVSSSESNPRLPLDQCVHQPLKLPEIGDFVKADMQKSTDVRYSCEDILKEMFPSNLLEHSKNFQETDARTYIPETKNETCS